MCRNIRTLFNFEPPATDEEVRASALQFVRKLSGFTHPVPRQRSGVHPRCRGGHGRGAPPPAIAGNGEPGKEPRGGSGESA